jgi:hypothetical protein
LRDPRQGDKVKRNREMPNKSPERGHFIMSRSSPNSLRAKELMSSKWQGIPSSRKESNMDCNHEATIAP